MLVVDDDVGYRENRSAAFPCTERSGRQGYAMLKLKEMCIHFEQCFSFEDQITLFQMILQP